MLQLQVTEAQTNPKENENIPHIQTHQEIQKHTQQLKTSGGRAVHLTHPDITQGSAC